MNAGPQGPTWELDIECWLVVCVKFCKFSDLVSTEFNSFTYLSLPRSSVGGVCSCGNALAPQHELFLVLL